MDKPMMAQSPMYGASGMPNMSDSQSMSNYGSSALPTFDMFGFVIRKSNAMNANNANRGDMQAFASQNVSYNTVPITFSQAGTMPDSGYGTASAGVHASASVYNDTIDSQSVLEGMGNDTSGLQNTGAWDSTIPLRFGPSNNNGSGGQHHGSSHSQADAHEKHSRDPIKCTKANCVKTFNTKAELRKHINRHNRPFRCDIQTCKRKEGFGTRNELDRHKRSRHSKEAVNSGLFYRCHYCKENKNWPRSDNLRSHLKSVHDIHDVNINDYIVRPSGADDGALLGIGGEQATEPSQGYIREDVPQVLDDMDLGSPSSMQPADLADGGQTFAAAYPTANQLFPIFGSGMGPAEQSRVSQDLIALFQSANGASSVPIAQSTLQGRTEAIQDCLSMIHTSRPPPVPAPAPAPAPGLQAIGLQVVRTIEASPSAGPMVVSTRPYGPKASPHRVTATADAQARVDEPVQMPIFVADDDGNDDDEGGNNEVDNKDHMDCNSPSAGCEKTENVCDTEEDKALPETGPAGPVTLASFDVDVLTHEQSYNVVRKLYSSGQLQEILEKIISESAEPTRSLSVSVPAVPAPAAAPAPLPVSAPEPMDLASTESVEPDNDKKVDDKSHFCTEKDCHHSFSTKASLTKHMKRHARPYYCTFPQCRSKDFGSKNDWKRHERSQHFRLGRWKCQEKTQENDDRAKSCDEEFTACKDFANHLKTHHKIADATKIDELAVNCYLGGRLPSTFWCGFCRRTVNKSEDTGDTSHRVCYSRTGKGGAAAGESAGEVQAQKFEDFFRWRTNHIDDHFMGRKGPKMTISEWSEKDRLNSRNRGMSRQDHDSSGESCKNGSRPSRKRAHKPGMLIWECCFCPNYSVYSGTDICVCEHRRCKNCKIRQVRLPE